MVPVVGLEPTQAKLIGFWIQHVYQFHHTGGIHGRLYHIFYYLFIFLFFIFLIIIKVTLPIINTGINNVATILIIKEIPFAKNITEFLTPRTIALPVSPGVINLTMSLTLSKDVSSSMLIVIVEKSVKISHLSNWAL